MPGALIVAHDLNLLRDALAGTSHTFGTDGYGEMYVAALASGSVYRIEVE